ncbi:MAG: cell division protein ZapA [Lachnospiraceae bacterium]|nr:cell division protein ZapA [Lachnospiraceae bacterium]
MAEKRSGTEVLIGGKVYSLAGADASYLQKVSGYLNSKIAEVKTAPGYRSLDADYRALLLNLNIADDYFKAQAEKEGYQKKAEELEKELYAARHDIVSTKLKLENSLKQQDVLEARALEWKEKYQSLAGSMGGDY